MRISKNPDEALAKDIQAKIKANDGYCICRVQRIQDNKCICKEFLNMAKSGWCHCKLYYKEIEGEER